jgi:hypothetical protein
MTYITAAFDAICTEAKEPETWYVCLVSSYQRYGGPEDGGWWQTMNEIVKYQAFMSKELANSAAEKIKALAEELTANSRAEYGQHCLNQMDWLEARGLDADYLPENDGPDEFSVHVYDELPSYDNTPVRWE